MHVRDSEKQIKKRVLEENLNRNVPANRRFYVRANSQKATIFRTISNTMNDNAVPEPLNCIHCLNCYCCDCVSLCAFPMTKSNYLRLFAMTDVVTVVQVRFLTCLYCSVQRMLVFRLSPAVATMIVCMRQLILHVKRLCDIIPAIEK